VDGRGGSLAPADGTVIRLNSHENSVGTPKHFRGHDDRLAHRQADRDRLDSFDLHAGTFGR
jgi:hypothetical protein